MAKVKGSPQYRMKVVPHRPLRRLLLWLLGLLLVVAAVTASYWFAGYQASQAGMSPEAAKKLRSQLASLQEETQSLRQQLAQAQMGAEVDRKSSEELRQLLLERREQISQLKRDISVYRMMSSRSSNNPLGISFGTFSVKPLDNNLQQLKLVVQKLAEGEDEFKGALLVSVVGKQAGVEQRIPLWQLAITAEGAEPMGEKIPLDFKYFQNIETTLRLPDGFVAEHLAVRLESSARRNPLVVEQQLEWLQPDQATP